MKLTDIVLDHSKGGVSCAPIRIDVHDSYGLDTLFKDGLDLYHHPDGQSICSNIITRLARAFYLKHNDLDYIRLTCLFDTQHYIIMECNLSKRPLYRSMPTRVYILDYSLCYYRLIAKEDIYTTIMLMSCKMI